MKKLILIVAVLAFTSCEKNYRCTCTTTNGGGTRTPVYCKEMQYVKHKEAKSFCSGMKDILGGKAEECTLVEIN